MKNRFYGALYVLLGRDKETLEDRAFRHERERGLLSLALYAFAGICVALALSIIVTGTIVWLPQILLYSIIAEILILFLYNAFFKWHQNKYGGD
ncbi:MAG: hypothetical protein UX08_C0003G0064 [Candidatus Collierbacteria bacterium GW2011_GWB1_45_35]|uniref:Uncharacterized protein n=2 Tax=Candidatus Collieribacteriota TaxID=1752725 RepID=A0A0G1MWB2_9BACT|nr:MAG: hypothetical protein UW48_C0006G0057 [Microgenomates group bacterium GW2011_GWC1_44_23]KKT85077.1 MAG: hypothetical protein UW84_C0042G0005 [Candidatus Collierbacteria bacterium GW2011_GWA2_44_99]KKT96030.1 MAG: hypothetical protein UW96_C0002G0057 [Candidatus Collierbacteria bacterium GW2011_GWA1_45_15]KKU01096.1 MAG: hypothetical protein UX01_C0002G0062 [Candidatus Collierbacteria bacterium GW2011_GWB2_45_17]KKU05708.1 MAG: hypothetical protein UX08_C0003G0064 [Candidatus Collierbacte